MVEGTVPKIIKCLMSFICSLLMSLGLTVMIFSICALHIEDMKKNVELAEEDLIAFAVMGGITFVVGFLGCFGACCENRILLCLFFALVTLLFIIELALAFSILLKKDEKGRELGWGFLGLAIFHFIGAVFSMILCVAITREQRDGGGQDVA